MPPKRAVTTYVNHRLQFAPCTACEQSPSLSCLHHSLRRVSLADLCRLILWNPTAQAFFYGCPAVGAHCGSSYSLAKLPPDVHVDHPCQWI